MAEEINESSDLFEYYYDIIHGALSMPSVWEKLKQHPIYQFAMQYDFGKFKLIEAEQKMVLDPMYVPWDDFHSDLIAIVMNNRATTKTSISSRSKKHSDNKMQLIQELSLQYPPSIAPQPRAKKEKWSSLIYALAIEFARILELSIVVGHASLCSRVEEILSTNWTPSDEAHCQKIYYVAGFLLNTIKKMEGRYTDDETLALLEFVRNASTNKSLAGALPSALVEASEKVSLMYANKEFYKCCVRMESVFHLLLSDHNVAIFGTTIIEDIGTALAELDIGFDKFLGDASDGALQPDIEKRIIEAYCNLRGKDFAQKHNSLAGFNDTQTLRSQLATWHAKVKKEALANTTKKNSKANRTKSKKKNKQRIDPAETEPDFFFTDVTDEELEEAAKKTEMIICNLSN